jgi:integrase
MSIRKAGNRWQVRLRIGGGRRIERTLPPGATAADARALEDQIRRAQVDLALGRRPATPIDAALDKWLREEVRHQKSARRTEQRINVLREFTRGKMLSELVDVAGQIKSADAAPATINRYLSALRRIGNLAEQWGWLERAPRIVLLPERNQRHVYLTPAQVATLARHCSREVGDLVRFAVLTGLRRSELLRLTPGDVQAGFLLLDARTKTGRPRRVPLPPEAARIAQARLPWRVDIWSLRRDFEAARVAAGLPAVQFRDLRHTYASWLAQSGQNLKTIRDLLGHTTLATTDRYAHLADDHLAKAVSGLKIGARVGKTKRAGRARKAAR